MGVLSILHPLSLTLVPANAKRSLQFCSGGCPLPTFVEEGAEGDASHSKEHLHGDVQMLPWHTDARCLVSLITHEHAHSFHADCVEV